MKTFGGMTTKIHQKHAINHKVFRYSVTRNRGMQNQQYSLRKTLIWENEKSARETLINLVVYEDFLMQFRENDPKSHRKALRL